MRAWISILEARHPGTKWIPVDREGRAASLGW